LPKSTATVDKSQPHNSTDSVLNGYACSDHQ